MMFKCFCCSVFTGKAQVGYSTLRSGNARVYLMVKAAILKFYELVPEWHCQGFCNKHIWSLSGALQMYMGMFKDFMTHLQLV